MTGRDRQGKAGKDRIVKVGRSQAGQGRRGKARSGEARRGKFWYGRQGDDGQVSTWRGRARQEWRK